MTGLTHAQRDDSILIRSDYWQVEHRASAGGCWAAIRFTHGSRKNLLAGPVGSRIRTNRILRYDDPESPVFPSYEERFEKEAALRVETTAEALVVIAEGTYRDQSGESLPVRYRHRYEYRDWGLVHSTLEILPERELQGVLEVAAVDMQLRVGLTHAYVRRHPISNPNVDLRGGFAWQELRAGATAFRDRYVPLHLVCFAKGVEGLEFFPASRLAQWDAGLSPDVGAGYYAISTGGDGRTGVLLSPYAVVFRRVPITLRGPVRLSWYWGLPFIKPRERTGVPYFHAGVDSHWPADADLARAAAAGVKLIRFHNDYRENGPFWRDGVYPPYDAAGMAQLRRVIDTAHRLGMKIVPYISVKELHPEAPGYAEHAEEWTQAAARSRREFHTWIGTGEFGRLMCLESGWLARRKADVEAILGDLPWDGLYFDWTKPLPCCHPGHLQEQNPGAETPSPAAVDGGTLSQVAARTLAAGEGANPGGQFHTDTDAYLDFLFFCRRRVGPEGIMFLHLSGFPYMVSENLSDLTFIYEDVGGFFPEPDRYPVHCPFVPIVSRYLATAAAAGSVNARRLIMGSLLQGHPPAPALRPDDDFGRELLAEMALFGGEDLRDYRLVRGGDRAAATEHECVYGAVWHRRGRAIAYLGNFSGRRVRGRFRFDPALAGWQIGKGALAGQMMSVAAGPRAVSITPAALRTTGLPYALGPWQSVMVHLER